MMKPRILTLLAAGAILFSGCIPSLKPFFTASDVIVDPRLEGLWQEAKEGGDPETWRFEVGENQTYRLLITEKEGKEGKFDAHLFKIGADFFLDLLPSECDFATNQAELVGFATFPGHLLVRVSQFEPELRLAFFDFDWLGKHLEDHPEAMAHYREDKRVILTADTPALQRFVADHLGEGELFGKPGRMVRKPMPATP